jgi:hypothetical protein
MLAKKLPGVPGSRVITHARDFAGGFYVYCYVENPIVDDLGQWAGGKLLYVGKGIDARAFTGHQTVARRVNRGETTKSAWVYKLAQMKREGAAFAVFALKEKLAEHEAYDFEEKLIKGIGRRNVGTGPLYNLTDGGDGLTSERARAMLRSPARKEAMREVYADPAWQAAVRAHLAKLHADPQQQQLCKQWGLQQAARRKQERGYIVAMLAAYIPLEVLAVEAKEAEEARRAKWRAAWHKRKERVNARRGEAPLPLRKPKKETKQSALRKTPEGRLARNAADRARRRRKRELVLGIESAAETST